ncbi:MAG: ribulose-phosphate 3-epimerase [Chitinophagales bacterium]|nr:ribulose-phosphate 3-epimerase [Chitinophagales bacterium]MDW8428466.1 ribulose-phosphate 3-epimerase [Chitinophagales bacterium]
MEAEGLSYLRHVVQLAPSILSADFTRLGEVISMLNRSEADWIHCDVMDGRFVPNISFGLPVIQAVRQIATKPLDVHLMIVEPEKYLRDFADLGVDILTVHVEACPHLHRVVQEIRQLGLQAGVALNPHTPIQLLSDIIHEVDLVCLMAVNPGFGGQAFIKHTYEKLTELRELIVRKEAKAKIEIDGGVDLSNAATLAAKGADILVAGNSIFSSKDPMQAIRLLKRTAHTISA